MRTAQRRHNDEKVLNRRLKTLSHRWIMLDERLDEKDRARWRGIIQDTGTICSCGMCRISRRYYGPSMQERRQIAWIGEKYGRM